MRKKLVQYAVVMVMVALCGCARRPAEAPLPPVVANEAASPPVVANEAASPPERAEETPKPLTARELERAAPKAEWPTPKGKLDDAKFAAVSARYVATVAGIAPERRTPDNILLALEAVLFEAKIEPAKYKAYAQQVSADPARKKRVGLQVVKLVEQRTGSKVDAETLQLRDAEAP